MTNIPQWLKTFFMFNAGHTYNNLSRLFLRLFTGIMFLQMGVRQMTHIEEFANAAMGSMGLPSEGAIVAIVVVEIVCAVFIILGLFTRLALIPSIGIMIYAETVMVAATSVSSAGQMFIFEPGYPIMFIGIFAYMLLAGPGKISLDYLIAIHTINEKDDEDSEVLEKA
ncbi:MAG: DoxX family protein [Muribaculaceae bacterium]|nr:DoxX family protein [Muribaculaceae bacterium]MBQ6278737.1 DoxX family protein [Muribaculaceae bacterium]MBR0023360.1 DoxX family protein [Muribaculaceae bacterium]